MVDRRIPSPLVSAFIPTRLPVHYCPIEKSQVTQSGKWQLWWFLQNKCHVKELKLDMKIACEFFWTDSQVALAYINNEARSFHILLAKCVEVIQDNGDANQRQYANTSENPATHAPRGLRASDINSTNWLRCLVPGMDYSS